MLSGVVSAIQCNDFWDGAVTGAIYGAINGFTTGAIMGLAQGLQAANQAVGAANAAKAKPTPNELGKQGEAYISMTRGIDKNTKTYRKKLNSKNRIPDFVSKGKGVLIESKNVARQSLTSQLKDYLGIANNLGVNMEIYVRQKTKLTSKLLQFIADNAIKLNYFPW